MADSLSVAVTVAVGVVGGSGGAKKIENQLELGPPDGGNCGVVTHLLFLE